MSKAKNGREKRTSSFVIRSDKGKVDNGNFALRPRAEGFIRGKKVPNIGNQSEEIEKSGGGSKGFLLSEERAASVF